MSAGVKGAASFGIVENPAGDPAGGQAGGPAWEGRPEGKFTSC